MSNLEQVVSLPWHAPAVLLQLVSKLVKESLQHSLAASILSIIIYKIECTENLTDLACQNAWILLELKSCHSVFATKCSVVSSQVQLPSWRLIDPCNQPWFPTLIVFHQSITMWSTEKSTHIFGKEPFTMFLWIPTSLQWLYPHSNVMYYATIG